MSGFFIAGFVLFGILTIVGAISLYTLFVYSKNTLFTKTKFSAGTIALYVIIFAILLITGILFLTTFSNLLEKENTKLDAILCFVFLFLDLLEFSLYIFIVKANNKHKIPYDKITKTDFKPDLEDIKKKIGDIEAFKAKLLKHHKKYILALNEQYSKILLRLKDKKIPQSEKYADIVMFNDTFSHKWSQEVNKYQLLLTYEFLTLI